MHPFSSFARLTANHHPSPQTAYFNLNQNSSLLRALGSDFRRQELNLSLLVWMWASPVGPNPPECAQRKNLRGIALTLFWTCSLLAGVYTSFKLQKNHELQLKWGGRRRWSSGLLGQANPSLLQGHSRWGEAGQELRGRDTREREGGERSLLLLDLEPIPPSQETFIILTMGGPRTVTYRLQWPSIQHPRALSGIVAFIVPFSGAS